MYSNRTKVVLSEGTKEIKDNVFTDCNKLQVVVLPDDIQFDQYTFAGLKKMVIHCHAGSEAEKLAIKYNLKYKIIE